jgi:hypothetical protein
MHLHLYPISGGYFVEEDETFRLLAHDPAGPVAWGFTDNSDAAHIFATAEEAAEMGAQWDPTLTAERVAK